MASCYADHYNHYCRQFADKGFKIFTIWSNAVLYVKYKNILRWHHTYANKTHDQNKPKKFNYENSCMDLT